MEKTCSLPLVHTMTPVPKRVSAGGRLRAGSKAPSNIASNRSRSHCHSDISRFNQQISKARANLKVQTQHGFSQELQAQIWDSSSKFTSTSPLQADLLSPIWLTRFKVSETTTSARRSFLERIFPNEIPLFTPWLATILAILRTPRRGLQMDKKLRRLWFGCLRTKYVTALECFRGTSQHEKNTSSCFLIPNMEQRFMGQPQPEALNPEECSSCGSRVPPLLVNTSRSS